MNGIDEPIPKPSMIERGKPDDFPFGEADTRMPPGIEVVQRYRSGAVPDHYSNVEPKLGPDRL